MGAFLVGMGKKMLQDHEAKRAGQPAPGPIGSVVGGVQAGVDAKNKQDQLNSLHGGRGQMAPPFAATDGKVKRGSTGAVLD